MESRTLEQIVARVRYLGDAEGLDDRHSFEAITAEVNAGIRAVRNLVTHAGAPYYLEPTTPANLSGTQVSGESYSEVPWPTDATSIHGIDIELNANSGDWHPLTQTGWGHRRWYSGSRAGLNTQLPMEFSIRRIPEGATAGAIALFPAASSGRYKIWYLQDTPAAVLLDDPEDAWLGMPDWHEWLAQWVVESLAERDDDQLETYKLAHQKRLEAEVRILAHARSMNRSGPISPKPRRRLTARRRY